MSGQGARAVLACMVTGALCLLPWAVGSVVPDGDGTAQAASPAGGAASASFWERGRAQVGSPSSQDAASAHVELVAGGDDPAITLFERLSGPIAKGSLPVGFAEDVVDPGALGTCQVLSGPGVVGMCWEGGARGREPVLEQVGGLLHENGWARLGATEAGSTYFRETGRYRWVNVQVYVSGPFATAVFVYEEEG